jgi:flagellar hook-associated protein 3 FlgL
MIPSLNPSSNLFLNGLTRLQTRITLATAELSSGRRISQPSDAPDQISPLLQLQAELSHHQAVASNLTSVQAEVSGADQAMSTAIQLLDQARSLAAQGATGTTSDATRMSLAQQVQSIQEQMVGLADTQVRGRYIFAGDQYQTQPYALDLNQAANVPQNGVDRQLIIPVASTRQIELSDQSFTSVDQTAQDLFDHRNADDSLAPDNVFAALNALRVALQNPGDPQFQANITAAQTSLQTASAYLNSKQTLYGIAQNRLAAAVTQINAENVNLQQQISSIRDTDVVQTALELTSAETQNQAAMAAVAKAPHASLFDFLG